jgi:hypothetical protein
MHSTRKSNLTFSGTLHGLLRDDAPRKAYRQQHHAGDPQQDSLTFTLEGLLLQGTLTVRG